MPKALILRLVALSGLWLALTALGGPKADLWPRWQTSGPGSIVDDSPFASFLNRYRSVGPDGVARLAYGKVSPADKARLKAYVSALSRTDVDRLTRPQQFAFWVNLYNAATVDLVLSHYPVTSITKVKDGFLSFGPWDRKLVSVKGERLSLNDVEHRILRPIWKDPRIHFIVNCASVGCPDIYAAPLRADTLEPQLNAARDAFLDHPRGAQLSAKGLKVSSIFHWYAVDFGGPAGVVRYLKSHGPSHLQSRLTATTKITGHAYDWSLNEAK
jgi:Protein of unknown function, DUF547